MYDEKETDVYAAGQDTTEEEEVILSAAHEAGPTSMPSCRRKQTPHSLWSMSR
jgi:hypothetical protein